MRPAPFLMPSRLFKNYKNLAKEFYAPHRVFVAFDTETTGLKAGVDYLLELGAVKFDSRGTIGAPFDVLIKPPVPITPFITSLTGITNDMVRDSPDAPEAIADFIIYIGGRKTVLVAHNAKFDLSFINGELEGGGRPALRNLCIDTLTASKWAYPDFARAGGPHPYALQSLAKKLDIRVERAHRAHDDARCCMELFKRILQDTEKRQNGFEREPILPKQPELF